MSAADPRLLVATELLEEHLPESVCESGCALRCGYHGDNIALHLAEAVLAAADAADPLRAEAVPRCTSTESGGVRCELPAGHQPPEAHWISPETINAHLYHRVTLIEPQSFTERSTKP